MAKKIMKKLLAVAKIKEVGIEKVKKTRIRVIGIGGGGGNIVSELAQRIEKATFVAANTDSQSLKEISRKIERFPFGQDLTKGLGTGMNPELAKTAALNEKERIKKILQGQDLVILIASFGGGTASGAAPIFAKISKSLGNLTYGIFTLPFKFEGERKMEIARSALGEIRSKLNAISIIPNERIFQIVEKTTPLKEALSAINKSLAESLEGLIEIIYEPGLINIDFADLKTILNGQGRLAYLNTAEIQRKEKAAKEGIEKVLNSPLYPYGIRGAKSVLYNIAGEKELNLEEVSQISKTISEKVYREAKIIFGISQGKKYHNLIKTTILATGLSTKNFFTTSKKTKLRKRPLRKVSVVEKKKTQKIIKAKKEPSVKSKFKKRKKQQKTEKKITPPSETETKEENPPAAENKIEAKVRKNALQIKREVEEVEKEMLEKESIWETPAFLRKKLSRG